MSSVQLLDKTRKIGKLLHNNNSSKVVFNDICSVLCEILDSNVLVISKKGKVLGVGDCEGVESITELIVDQVGGFIDGMLNERLLAVLSTKENVNLETLGFEDENVRKFQAIITPIEIAGERLGTLFIYKCDQQYDIDDIILNICGGVFGFYIYLLLDKVNKKLPAVLKKPIIYNIIMICLLALGIAYLIGFIELGV